VREEKNNGKGGAKMDSKHVTLTCIYELRGQFISLEEFTYKMLEDYFFYSFNKKVK
jgi:hypothetical protein